jgi:hypothetical protein
LPSGEVVPAEYSADFMSLNLTYWGTIIGTTKEMEFDTIVSPLTVNLPMTLVTYHYENVTAMMPMPTLTECSVYYCEKQYSPTSHFLGQQENFSVNVSRTQPLIPIYYDPRHPVEGNIRLGELRSPNGITKLSEDSSYYIDVGTILSLKFALQNTLNFTYYQEDLEIGYMGLPTVITRNDIGLSLESMSNGFTDTLRQNAKSYKIPGEAYDFETIIEVRWPWIILPVCAVLGTVLLLLGTVLTNKRQDMILLKSSVNPLLAARVQTSPKHDIASLQSLVGKHRRSKEADVTIDQGKGVLFLLRKKKVTRQTWSYSHSTIDPSIHPRSSFERTSL